MGNLQLSSGTLFHNRFEIQRTAGSGGMGTVYRAIDRHTGDVVALKLLHSGTSGGEEAKRFVREAQLLSELRHPCIVAHAAHGQTLDGQRFLAMEWLEGEDLGARLARGPLPMRDCLLLLDQVASALAAAHQRGIIHRDLKPANLFLVDGDVGRVKLLDFGIARHIDASSVMTKTGMIVGTPEYMAPEQARGSRDLTPAADLFSLGCVLYECLTGQPPFVADHIAAVLVRILFEEPVPVEDRRPGVPAALLGIVVRLLAKDPAQRMADATTLRTELRGLGELPEPNLAATVASPQPKVESVSGQEQNLFSIVLAEPVDGEMKSSATPVGISALYPASERPALFKSLAALGGSPDFLIDGTLLVTVPPLGTAQDQATLAARCALVIKGHWPSARVVLSTGLGALHRRIPHGAVMERIESLLRTQRSFDPTVRNPETAEIVMDDLTASFIQGRFLIRELSAGIFALLSESVAPDQRHLLLGRPTPCLGRERELALLEELMIECMEEKTARSALVIAPSGVGKSRLQHEFLRRMEARIKECRAEVLVGRGDPVAMGISYGLIGQALRQLCRVVTGEDVATSQAKFEKRISANLNQGSSEVRRIVEFLGEMCSVPFPDSDSQLLRAARQDPNLLADQIGQAFMDFLTAECAQRPIVLVFDDLQWGDFLTVRLVDAALRELQEDSFMVLALARPEVKEVFPKLWSGRGVREVQLPGLSKRACEGLIDQMLGPQAGSETRARLIKQAAGNVLFLEELIRATAEGREDALPESVLAMLQARLGRLEPTARRLMRMASVFGETFWLGGIHELIAGELPRSEIGDLLQGLIEAELIERHRVSRFSKEVEYGFHHATVRDAAYGLFTQEEARRAHARAGAFLEAVGEGDPTILAEHARRAGDHARAVSFYIKASKQAYDNNDLAAALARAERAVSSGASGASLGIVRTIMAQIYFAQRVPEPALQAGKDALGQLPRGSYYWYRALDVVLVSALLFVSHESHEDYLQLLVETEPEPDTKDWCLVLAAKTLSTFAQKSMFSGAQLILGFINRFSSLDARDNYERGVTSIGMLDYQRHTHPDPWKQLQLAKAAVAGFRETGDWRSLVICLDNLAQCYWEIGNSAAAETTFQESLALVGRMKEPYSIPHVKMHRLWLLTSRAQPEDLVEADRIVAELVQAAGLSKGYHGWLLGLRAQLCLHKGQALDAERLACESMTSCTGSPFRRLAAVTTKVLALLRQERNEEARAEADAGLAEMLSLGYGGYIEIPLRTAAALSLAAVGDLPAARLCIQAGVNELRRQEEKLPDAATRECFLHSVPVNAQLLDLSRRLAREPADDHAP